MPPYIENPYCYIVTKLQCDVTKKMQGPDTDVNAKDYYDGAMELLKK
ncbi:hypothetical protein SAMN04487901_11150 [Prevotella communis]|uniref:Uncharacterized protein n=1 Tax=Prevotella communis TaxID=2913614 RepID=A0A1G7XQT0_9BACT|nr:hypothetical protein SAMN04487901_11150 [Prevotella communis]